MMEHNQLYYNVTNDYVDISNFKKITNIRYNTLTDKCHIMLDEVLAIETSIGVPGFRNRICIGFNL